VITSRMPAPDYRELEALNITRLKEMRRSPQHYQWALTNPKATDTLTLGTAAHVAVLEPERFAKQFATWERRTEAGAMAPRRGQYWEEFERANKGKEIITADQDYLARAIAQAVRGDARAMRYLEAGEPEVVMEWEAWGRKCKGRLDWLTHIDGEPVLVGLKSARDCRPFIFGSAAAKLGYALQWAFYQNGFAIIKGGERPRMVEIVVESAPPHAVVVYRIPDDVLLYGEEEFLKLIELLDRCERDDEWPGPATDEQVLSLPSWVYQADDDISDLGLTP
jgi:PDDEXK-like domain of unknown function (DUF3799)